MIRGSFETFPQDFVPVHMTYHLLASAFRLDWVSFVFFLKHRFNHLSQLLIFFILRDLNGHHFS